MSPALRAPYAVGGLVGAVVLALAVGGVAALPAAGAASSTDPGGIGATIAADELWTPVDQPLRRSADGLRRRVAPTQYAAHRLDLPALEGLLERAPSELHGGGAPVTIVVPSPEGDPVVFRVTESPVMEPELAADHPGIRTYVGRTTTAGSVAGIRLDVTPMGFHASVRGDGASWYVDPAYNGADQGADALYVSYRGDALPERQQALVEPGPLTAAGPLAKTSGPATLGEGGGAVAVQRTYRLALASDPSYAAYFAGGATTNAEVNAIVTAEKVTLMNRVNQLYGDDFSIRMVLVAGNDRLNFNTAAQFLSPNGRCGQLPCYTAEDIGCDQVIDTNRFVVGQVIGAERYDVGHIMFGPDGDGGGVAYLGAVGTAVKAGGCTGLNPPTGDGFAVDFVAHEMGHQFAGNHTFNGTNGACAGANRNAGTSVEPGSGSSVMAYAGICRQDDLQPHTDPYFSQRTQSEVAAFARASARTDNEIQNVALSGFGSGESFTLSYGAATSSTITQGSTYTAAGIKAAVEAAEPSGATASVTGFWGRSSSLTNGFQITWSGRSDIATPVLSPVSGTFGSIVGTTDNGGAETNGGSTSPGPSGNRNPVVSAPEARTIPLRTPFTLTGSATDADGDALVHLWEQNDTTSNGSGLTSNAKTSGALFRVFGRYAAVTSAGSQQYSSPGENRATASPSRSFPDAAQVATGATNAATGSCPATGSGSALPDGPVLECYSEFLPTNARTLRFRLTARDLGGSDGGSDGGTAYADTTLTVGSAGPFAVTSQSSSTSVDGGATATVSWSVAGTRNTTYATHVRLLLSTDGGLTFPTVLSDSTPNDGSAGITWPNVATSKARIKVEAVDNYFYDVNDADVTIVRTPDPTLTLSGSATGSMAAVYSDPLPVTPTVTAASSSVDGTAITATATGLPTGLTLSRTASSAPGVRPGTTTFAVSGEPLVDPGTYPVTVTVRDAAAPDQRRSFDLVVGPDTATLTYTGDTTATAPATGTDVVDLDLAATVVDTDATPGVPAGTVAFRDQATDELLCTAPVVDGAAGCSFGADLSGTSRTYQVVAGLTSIRYSGTSAAAPVTVTLAGSEDTTPPETRITRGPAEGSLVLGRTVTFRYDAEPGATYECRLDSSVAGSTALSCPASGVVRLREPAGGSYELRIAAVDEAGNADLSPATRRFVVPLDDRDLGATRAWRRARDGRAFRATVTTTSRKRAVLTTRVQRIDAVSLVVTRAPRGGSVTVFLGRTKLRTVRTGARSVKRRQVVDVASFDRPRSGRLRVVTTSRRTVRIDGLGVTSDPSR